MELSLYSLTKRTDGLSDGRTNGGIRREMLKDRNKKINVNRRREKDRDGDTRSSEKIRRREKH